MKQQHRRFVTATTVVAAALALIGFSLTQFAVDASLRHWHENAEGYQTALRLQSGNGKPIALFFHTDWCQNCKRLREQVLATPEVDRYLKNAIPVKINPEMGLKERQIADSYGVRGYPTFLMVTRNPDAVKPVRSPRNLSPAEFVDQCKQAS